MSSKGVIPGQVLPGASAQKRSRPFNAGWRTTSRATVGLAGVLRPSVLGRLVHSQAVLKPALGAVAVGNWRRGAAVAVYVDRVGNSPTPDRL